MFPDHKLSSSESVVSLGEAGISGIRSVISIGLGSMLCAYPRVAFVYNCVFGPEREYPKYWSLIGQQFKAKGKPF